MIDDIELDRLGRRAANAVRDRAREVADGAPAPKPLQRTRTAWRGGGVAVAATAAAVAIAVGAGALLGTPPRVSISPLAPGATVTPTEPTPSPDPSSERPVTELVDNATQDAWYMTAEGYDAHLEGRHDEVCTWVRDQVAGDDIPAPVDSPTHRRLHEAVQRHLTYGSDGLPLALGAVCGVLEPYHHSDSSGIWWDNPPYPWESATDGHPATPVPSDESAVGWLRAMAHDGPDVGLGQPAGYMDEATFAEHLTDRIGEVCAWVDQKVSGADGHFEAQDKLRRAYGDAATDGLALALLAVCGYYGDTAEMREAWERFQDAQDSSQSKPVWFFDPPYPWGEPLEAAFTYEPFQQ